MTLRGGKKKSSMSYNTNGTSLRLSLFNDAVYLQKNQRGGERIFRKRKGELKGRGPYPKLIIKKGINRKAMAEGHPKKRGESKRKRKKKKKESKLNRGGGRLRKHHPHISREWGGVEG